MGRGFGLPETRTRLRDAVAAVERRTGAEVVVSLRERSAGYGAARLAVGIVAGVAVLAYLLYAEAAFPLHWFLVDVVLTGALVGWLVGGLEPIVRLFSREADRRANVHAAAAVRFLDQGVHGTQARVGVLLHVSVVERRVELVSDLGVEKAVEPHRWAEVRQHLDAVFDSADAPSALIASIEELGDVLERYVPRAFDDRNELPDGVDA